MALLFNKIFYIRVRAGIKKKTLKNAFEAYFSLYKILLGKKIIRNVDVFYF